MRYDLTLAHVVWALLAWGVFFAGWAARRWWERVKAEEDDAIQAQQCADLRPPTP